MSKGLYFHSVETTAVDLRQHYGLCHPCLEENSFWRENNRGRKAFLNIPCTVHCTLQLWGLKKNSSGLLLDSNLFVKAQVYEYRSSGPNSCIRGRYMIDPLKERKGCAGLWAAVSSVCWSPEWPGDNQSQVCKARWLMHQLHSILKKTALASIAQFPNHS